VSDRTGEAAGAILARLICEQLRDVAPRGWIVQRQRYDRLRGAWVIVVQSPRFEHEVLIGTPRWIDVELAS
jgi:hypothetical protein